VGNFLLPINIISLLYWSVILSSTVINYWHYFGAIQLQETTSNF